MNYFKPQEFDCKCGCGLNKISPEFVRKLSLLRHICGFPFYVTSGSRCENKNKACGGKSNSDHLVQKDGLSHAADIRYTNGQELYLLITHAPKFFKRIGIGKSFVHLGDWEENPQNTAWTY